MPDTTVIITVAKKGKEPTTFSFMCDKYLISEERGTKAVYKDSDQPTEFQNNGHWRFALKAWRGCQTYDTFVSGEQVDHPATVVGSGE